jgi:predicted AAA+ superfamily ATPase
MSKISEIERKIQDFRQMGLASYTSRIGKVHMVDHMVSTLVGARRSGKSFRARQVADEMLKRGCLPSLEHVCPVDFDNPILSSMSAVELNTIQETFLKISPGFGLSTPLLFLLDEIHKIDNWEEYVIDLSRNPNWKVIVTGSSSKLLREDISTELRGKAITSTVYPLDFTEFLAFSQAEHAKGSTLGNAERKRLFDQYLLWGGFPALVPLPEETKEAVLQEYLDTMMLKDLIQRYNIANPNLCAAVCAYLLSVVGKPYTQASMMRYLEQAGFKTSKETLRDYMKWCEDSWLLFAMPIFTDSRKKQERNYKKIYAIDWALANFNSPVWDGSLTRAFENMVYLHLRRKWGRLNYYLTRDKTEVDFIVSNRGKPDMAVQVSLDVSAPHTFSREIAPLIKTASYFGISNNVLVTRDQEETVRQQGVTVRIVPAYKWLCEG